MSAVERRARVALQGQYADYLETMTEAWISGSAFYSDRARDHYYRAGQLAWIVSGRGRPMPVVPHVTVSALAAVRGTSATRPTRRGAVSSPSVVGMS